MQPAALVLPASVRILVHSVLLTILSKISVADAVSREVNDILRIESIIGVESKDLISTCSMVSFNKSDFFISLL
jgi:hypothetical protein